MYQEFVELERQVYYAEEKRIDKTEAISWLLRRHGYLFETVASEQGVSDRDASSEHDVFVLSCKLFL
jgi:hypothetical protein